VKTSELDVRGRELARQAIDFPEAVLLVRLRHLMTNSSSSSSKAVDVAVANVHVTWSQLNYPALQALQVNTLCAQHSLSIVMSSSEMMKSVLLVIIMPRPGGIKR